jgi:hypothetical protein
LYETQRSRDTVLLAGTALKTQRHTHINENYSCQEQILTIILQSHQLYSTYRVTGNREVRGSSSKRSGSILHWAKQPGNRGSIFVRGKRCILCHSDNARSDTHSVSSRELNRLCDHSSPSTAEIKDAWTIYSSTPLPVFMVWCLTRQTTLPFAFNLHNGRLWRFYRSPSNPLLNIKLIPLHMQNNVRSV